MPKRKRNVFESSTAPNYNSRKQDVYEKLQQTKKLLRRALKTAKSFERQKLGKRLKLAYKEPELSARISREIEAVKNLDLDKTTDAHLHRSLLKIKEFAQSELLPDEVRKVIPRLEGTDEMIAALHNVTSQMLAMPQVKEVMEQAVVDICFVMGIPESTVKARRGKRGLVEGILAKQEELGTKEGDANTGGQEADSIKVERYLEWDGFDSEIDEESERERSDEDLKYESLDEDKFSRYEALVRGSSDDDSCDEATYPAVLPIQSSGRFSASLSPSTSRYVSAGTNYDADLKQHPSAKPTKSVISKHSLLKTGSSTFLPTLLGGYWSGSESASDIEDQRIERPESKNRPGQQARRTIWEKKYGAKANHIKSGKGIVSGTRDNNNKWGARGAAKSGGKEKGDDGFGGTDRRSHRSSHGNFNQLTGANNIAMESPKSKISKKDDSGILHPSWQAAKKSKEAQKAATFQGKKVLFD